MKTQFPNYFIPFYLILTASVVQAQVINDDKLNYQVQLSSVYLNYPGDGTGNRAEPAYLYHIENATDDPYDMLTEAEIESDNQLCFDEISEPTPYGLTAINRNIVTRTEAAVTKYDYTEFTFENNGGGTTCEYKGDDNWRSLTGGRYPIKKSASHRAGTNIFDFTAEPSGKWFTSRTLKRTATGDSTTFRQIWRYTNGEESSPLDFGTVNRSSGFLTHLNSNFQSGIGADAKMTYPDANVYYKFNVPEDGLQYEIYTNSGFNIKVSLHKVGEDAPILEPYEDDGDLNATLTNLRFALIQNLCEGEYYIKVGSGSGQLSAKDGAFSIGIQAKNISYSAGTIEATVSTACDGGPIPEISNLTSASGVLADGISYQWFKAIGSDGSFGSIPGATEATLTSSQAGMMPSSPNGISTVRFQRKAYACVNENEETSNIITITESTLPSNIPTNVSADSTQSNAIEVSWDYNIAPGDPDRVTGFIIERTADGHPTKTFNIDPAERTYNDNETLGCVAYNYKVKIATECFQDGVGSNSDISVLTPDLSGSFATDGTGFLASKGYYTNKIELNWINKNETNTNKILINRRVLGSGDDFIPLASENVGPPNTYIDNSAEAGILYEYELYAQTPCVGAASESNRVTAVGFRIKSGRVSGQVRFEGAGNVVKDVLIDAKSENNVQGGSLKFGGAGDLLMIENPSNLPLVSEEEFLNELFLETWIKPLNNNANYDIFNRDDSYRLSLNAGTNEIEFEVEYGGVGESAQLSISKDSLLIGNWSHIAAQVRADSMFIYINGDLLNAKLIGHIEIDNSDAPILIGRDFDGYLKELRIWNTSKSHSNAQRDHSRYVNGSEPGLRVFLPMNEPQGSFAYDRSKLNVSAFNRNHGQFVGSLIWSTAEAPTNNQLNFRSYTDENGNYLMNLPYFNAGETYTLRPIFFPHEFDPDNKLIFVGDGATVLNAVDFVDISSFRVRGRLTYYGTNMPCGVDGAFIKIDGEFVLEDGQPEKTANGGFYDIRVPIGKHFIEIEQAGHVYSEGRYPPIGLTSDNKINFQDSISNLNFVDSTFIKIIGKAIGGEREAQRPYGQTINNVGKADITWESESGCVLRTIATDETTGEYEVSLPPLKYKANVNVISEIDADYYKFNGVNELVAYDGPPLNKVIRDTTIFENGDPPIVDSINYNYEKIFQTFRKPSLIVRGNDGGEFIGEKEYVFTDSDGISNTIDLGFVNGELPMGWPVFIKGKSDPYRMLVKVFEEYTNKDLNVNNPRRDSVPTTVGTLYFNNTIADSTQFEVDEMYIGENGDIKVNLNDVNSIDTLKNLIYSFNAGTPNFGGDRLKSMTIRYENPADPTSNIYWDPNYLPGNDPGDEIFKGYIMGSRNLGGNWFTAGPQRPDFILRDPPGSGSTATREVGSTNVKNRSWSWKSSNEASTTDKINAGANFVAGIGISTVTTIKNDTEFGFKATLGGGRSGDLTEEIETTHEWSTNGTTDQVGVGSDIYIGRSMNFEHSITEILSIVPSSFCNDPVAKISCIGGFVDEDQKYRFAEKIGFAIEPNGYQTNFIFSQSFIQTRLIPELQKIKLALLQSSRYTSNEIDSLATTYGTNNDDPIWGAQAADCGLGITPCLDLSNNGPSYTFLGDIDDPEDIDSIRYINQQIKLWEDAIRLNEWEKANIGNEDTLSVYRQRELNELENTYRSAIDATIATGVLLGASSIVASFGLIASPLPGTSVSGIATFAVTTSLSIGAAEVAEEYEEYLLKVDRVKDKYNSILPKNYSLSSGTSLTREFATSLGTSIKGSLEYSIGTELSAEIEAKVNGTGIEFEKSLEMNFEYERDWSEETKDSESVSFTLSDDDQPDFFSVDVYESILGFGPIFKMKEGGQTSCPYEDEVYSQFYKENDQPVLLSGKTRQIDVPEIIALKDKLTGIPADQEAAFVVNLKNATLTGEAREFRLAVLASSNPNGAVVTIDGLGSNNVFLAADEELQKIVSVKIGPDPTILEYDSIAIILYAPCQYEGGTSDNLDIVSTAYISAHFLPSCSDVELQSPLDQWVVNNSYNDNLPIVMSGYDVNYGGLERLKFGYKKAEDPEFVIRESFWIDTTGQPSQLPISSTSSATLYNWDIKDLKDGSYDLVMESACPINSLDADDIKNVSQIRSGYIDRQNPEVFGTPSPADGILDPNDDILVRFNEPLNAALIEPENFQIIGTKNGAPIRHEVGLFFDGDDYATIPEYQLQSRSFTVEFWMKRETLGEQIIISQGQSLSDQLAISFNASDQLTFQLGDKTLTSSGSYTDLTEWHHYAIVYDRENLNAEIIVDFTLDNANNSFGTDYNSTGSIYVGRHNAGNIPSLKAFMHELRFWSIPRSESEISEKSLKSMSGRESGLIGNWSMDEAYGNKAADKVRRRDATITGASWSILPQNHSFALDGIADYLESSNTNTWGMTEESDITLEGWFKTNASGEQTILSNGKADGTRPEKSAWRVFLTSDGAVTVQNDGNTVASPSGYNDGRWHHFSIVVERSKAVSVYMDSDLVTTGNAANFGDFSGPKFWLGCRGWFLNNEVRDQYFEGNIDEIRIWNLARKPEQIQRDFVHQMNGDELGLQVYYPFNDITIANNNPSRIPSLNGQGLQNFNLSLGSNTATDYDEDAPPVKLPRLRENISFTYSINNDEIFIDITEADLVIENVTVDITVEGVQDHAGNVMQSPETWIAYINKNQVFWEEEYFSFEKELEDNLSFTAKIKNTGGSQESYSLGNLPSWLTASPSSGLIDPNSTVEVTLNVQALLNIGEYEQDIFVTTESFGFNERLLLDLKVSVDPPTWVVDADDFDQSMNIVGQFEINDVISTDDGDMVSVWVNDTLRGVSHVEFDPSSGKHLVFLTVLSKKSSGEALEFRAWDASRGRLLKGLMPDDITFIGGDILNSRTSPLPIKATVLTELTYILNEGWNWISFPLDHPDLLDINTTVEELSPSESDQIKSQTIDSSQTFLYSGGTWYGNTSGVTTNQAYKINVAKRDTFRYEGTFIDPSTEPIDIIEGWNWIGVKSEFIIDVPSAMSSLDPQTGDLIKGQRSFAIYEDGFGWGGNLDFLKPQQGYMLKYHTVDQLIYPGNLNARDRPESKLKSRSQKGKEYAKVEKSLGYINGSYSSTMSLTAAVDDCIVLAREGTLDLSQWLLAVHAGDECRGVVESVWIESLGKYLYYLSIEGNSDVPLSFTLVHNSNGTEIVLSQSIDFASNGITGSSLSPYNFSCVAQDDCITERMYQNADIDMSQSEITQQVITDLRSNATLPTGRIFRFKAGRSIEFIKEFQVHQGAILEAYIEDCITTKQ